MQHVDEVALRCVLPIKSGKDASNEAPRRLEQLVATVLDGQAGLCITIRRGTNIDSEQPYRATFFSFQSRGIRSGHR